MDENRELLDHYREAWTKFEASVRRLQAAFADGSGENLQPLFLDVETARLKYSSARDHLVSRMLGAEILNTAPESDQARIRGSAQLLWEFGGKRWDSAEKDWLCAEAMVRRASAAS